MAAKNLSLAKKTYDTLLNAVEANGWKCSKDEKAFKIEYGVNGDTFHMDFVITLDVERQLVILKCPIPVTITRDNLSRGVMAVVNANYALADGYFDVDMQYGTVKFVMTTCYRDSAISKEAFLYLLNFPTWAADKFYKPIADVMSGARSLQSFIDEYVK